MDGRLVKAAADGDIDYLGKLMTEDMFLLDTVAVNGSQTPLHIASMRGHVSFVKEMLYQYQKKQFAEELNEDGFTPLHLASANGHLQVVVELLKVDHGLCGIPGRDRRIPLHCAVAKGRIHVMEELLRASPDTVEKKTVRGDTPLHVAVKNNQFDALNLLVEHVKEHNMERLLNEKDDQGNTILHLAAFRKQYEVVHLLLDEDEVVKKVIEVNSLNERGMSALDLLMIFESEAGDLEIHTALVKAAGAKIGKDLIDHQVDTANINMVESLQVEIIHDNQLPPSTQQADDDDDLPKRIRFWPTVKEMTDLFGYKHKKDSMNDVRNILLTVATLLATATYQAVLSPPGGIWQEDLNGNTAGKSILATKSQAAFWLFILGNSIGFYTSFHMIACLTIGFPLQYPLLLLIFSISFNYSSSITSLAPDWTSYVATSAAIGFGYLSPLIPSVIRRLKKIIL